jgi:hypothetical protein
MDLGQISAEQRVERGPGIEARLVPSFGVPHRREGLLTTPRGNHRVAIGSIDVDS